VTQANPKIVLSASRDIPFNKLVLSQSNVRRIKAGVSIEELAEDIGRRTLLQSLTVRAVVDDDGIETGIYEIPAGGRRYRALDLLVRQKRLAKTAPIPCVIREGGIAEEDSLAENIQRAPLHPLDQFRAFLSLREKGQSEEDIAAAFFVAVAVVRQRLRLASVSPKLLDVYAEDGLTLDQLMAFTVNGDHERQEQVFEQVQQSHLREPYHIRRMLTQEAVRACDKRAVFVGEAYEDAGGVILRDLFQGDDGGWLRDVALVERLVSEKLEREAEAIRAEGWKWIEVGRDFPYGHTYGLRQVRGEAVDLSEDEVAARDALRAELATLEETYAEVDELPEEVDRRAGEIEMAMEALERRPMAFDPVEVARAGVFVSIDSSGALKVERGFVRPEDELPVPEAHRTDIESATEAVISEALSQPDSEGDASGDSVVIEEPEEEDGIKPLPDRLLTELTAHRTVALREALCGRFDVAFLAVLHALCLKVFYPYAADSCLQIEVRRSSFEGMAPGLVDTDYAKVLDERHAEWMRSMPKDPADLWDQLATTESKTREALFAYCAALSVNAVHESWNRRPRAVAHGDQLAAAVGLDMVDAGWTPTVDNYFGRVTKARIVQAVREAKGDAAAEAILPLKKPEMAAAAEERLAGSGWLPEPLRTRRLGQANDSEVVAAVDPGTEVVVDRLAEEDAPDEGTSLSDEEGWDQEEGVAFLSHAIAAE
jgi:ParB family chromosome partitioning protein